MAIIDPDGLFGGDRLRRCSNEAQLHWTRLFLASDGYARIEINYAKIVGRAYSTFNPIPTEAELQACLREYAENYLLFVYDVDGQVWGQWDTRPEFLPRYKTAVDRRSPPPPEQPFIDWKKRYREENKAFPKCFGNISESFLHGVGVGGGVGVGIGVGKNLCASPGDARVSATESQTQPAKRPASLPDELTPQQHLWFAQAWRIYWRRVAKKPARRAFGKAITTAEIFGRVLAAIQSQTPEMLAREAAHRPHFATWLNQERWGDEAAEPPKSKSDLERDELRNLLGR
jgi:hypothetical protein